MTENQFMNAQASGAQTAQFDPNAQAQFGNQAPQFGQNQGAQPQFGQAPQGQAPQFGGQPQGLPQGQPQFGGPAVGAEAPQFGQNQGAQPQFGGQAQNAQAPQGFQPGPMSPQTDPWGQAPQAPGGYQGQAPQGFQPPQEQAPQGFQPQGQGGYQAPQTNQAPQGFQPPADQAPGGFANPSGAPVGDPFASPAGMGEGHKIKDDMGAAVLVRPESFTANMKTDSGESDVIRCDWAVLDGPNRGALRSNALIFNKGMVRDLKKVLDGPQIFLVGRVYEGNAKKGQSAPVLFADAPEVIDVARSAAGQLGWV